MTVNLPSTKEQCRYLLESQYHDDSIWKHWQFIFLGLLTAILAAERKKKGKEIEGKGKNLQLCPRVQRPAAEQKYCAKLAKLWEQIIKTI